MGADVVSLDEARARLRGAPAVCPRCGTRPVPEPDPEPAPRHISDDALLAGEL